MAAEARTTIACGPCRKLHKKCDGMLPYCTRCISRGVDCHYPDVVGATVTTTAAAVASDRGPGQAAARGQESEAGGRERERERGGRERGERADREREGTREKERQRKRRASDFQSPRTKVACLACKAKKTKCDGEQPVCGRCSRQKAYCVYPDVFGNGDGPRKMLRVSTASRARKSGHGYAGNANERAPTPMTVPPAPSSEDDIFVGENDVEGDDIEADALGRPARGEDEDGDVPSEDGFVASPPASDVDEEHDRSPTPEQEEDGYQDNDGDGDGDGEDVALRQRFASLVQAVRQRVDAGVPALGETMRLAARAQAASQVRLPVPEEADYILPGRGEADRMLAAYLAREFVNLPVLDLVDFEAKYGSLWSDDGGDFSGLPVFYGTLNLLFALGIVSTEPERHAEAASFFGRGYAVVWARVFEPPALDRVQAHLVATQYLVAVDDLDAAWLAVGLAKRMAQSLRLHLAGSGQAVSDAERDLCRRLWHSCRLMERVVSLQMGCPDLIPDKRSLVPLPAPEPLEKEAEYLDTVVASARGGPGAAVDGFGSGRPSIMQFFNAWVTLSDRLPAIMDLHTTLTQRLATASDDVENEDAHDDSYYYADYDGRHPCHFASYHSSSAFLRPEDEQRTAALDRSLCGWLASLPRELHPDAPAARLGRADANSSGGGGGGSNGNSNGGVLGGARRADNVSPIAARQARILRLRYLHARLLLFRPHLAMYACGGGSRGGGGIGSLGRLGVAVGGKGSGWQGRHGRRRRRVQMVDEAVDGPLARSFLRTCAAECVRAAVEMVAMLAVRDGDGDEDEGGHGERDDADGDQDEELLDIDGGEREQQPTEPDGQHEEEEQERHENAPGRPLGVNGITNGSAAAADDGMALDMGADRAHANGPDTTDADMENGNDADGSDDNHAEAGAAPASATSTASVAPFGALAGLPTAHETSALAFDAAKVLVVARASGRVRALALARPGEAAATAAAAGVRGLWADCLEVLEVSAAGATTGATTGVGDRCLLAIDMLDAAVREGRDHSRRGRDRRRARARARAAVRVADDRGAQARRGAGARGEKERGRERAWEKEREMVWLACLGVDLGDF